MIYVYVTNLGLPNYTNELMIIMCIDILEWNGKEDFWNLKTANFVVNFTEKNKNKIFKILMFLIRIKKNDSKRSCLNYFCFKIIEVIKMHRGFLSLLFLVCCS